MEISKDIKIWKYRNKFIPLLLYSLITLLLCVYFPGLIYGEKQDSLKPGLSIIQSDDYGVVLELITPSFKTKERIVDGSTYQLIELPYKHSQTDEKGKPQVPVKGVLLGIPDDASIKVKVLDYDEVILSGYNLYPAPEAYLEKKLPPRLKAQEDKKQLKQLDERALNRFKYRFIKDDSTYSEDKFYPDCLAEVFSTSSLRGVEIAKLELYPIQFNPVTGKLRFCKRLRVEVDFGKIAEFDGEAAEDTPAAFKKLYKGILQNYEEVKYWKKGKKAKSGLADLTIPTEPALPEPLPKLIPYPAYQLSVNEDGIYRLTGQDLNDAGIDLFSLNPRNIKIYNQGKQIHIYVKGEEDGSFGDQDYIEFYAKAVDSRYTSTNIYWLTFTGEPGLRMKTKDVQGENPLIPSSFKSIYHLERNEMYWMELPDAGYVDDHWFFYDMLWDGASVDFILNLSDVANVDDNAKLALALRGISYVSYGFPDLGHHSRIYLNGQLIDDATWATAGEYKLETNVPQSYLKPGDNIIRVNLPGDTGADFELVLVNWFELSYWRQFKAKGNYLEFSHQGDGLYLYKVANFTKPDVEIFDITDVDNVERIVNFGIEFAAAPYTVSFKDQLMTQETKEYIALTPEMVKKPATIVEDAPSNLRSTQNRADYIIITHEDFYDAVLPLAEHYTSKGFRVKVVKVGDIYDEFNYGIFNPQAIKDFLTYTYNNWAKPAPTYVLLVGDGTYDYRDYEGFGVKNYVPTYMVHSLDFGETGSDNWFVCLDGQGDFLPDMFIGRFPVKTVDETNTVVNKILDY